RSGASGRTATRRSSPTRRGGALRPGSAAGAGWYARRCAPAVGSTGWSTMARDDRVRIEVPADSPLFAGHFPGHPILPGIAHLSFVEQALGSPITAARSVRLRRPVTPRETLDLALSSGG